MTKKFHAAFFFSHADPPVGLSENRPGGNEVPTLLLLPRSPMGESARDTLCTRAYSPRLNPFPS